MGFDPNYGQFVKWLSENPCTVLTVADAAARFPDLPVATLADWWVRDFRYRNRDMAISFFDETRYIGGSFVGESAQEKEGVITYLVPHDAPFRDDWDESDWSAEAEYVIWRYTDGPEWDSRGGPSTDVEQVD